MNKPKHTPGPWDQSEFKEFKMIVVKHDYLNQLEVVLAISEDNDIGEDEMLANARLIAAAPELLEALEVCVDNECTNYCDVKEFGYCDKTCKYWPYKKLIAKTKGNENEFQ
jgi:hypothetical protein